MGTLSITGTPIGNLEDITLRALRTLAEADVIFCEDTRMTAKLLARHEIKVSLKRLDANTELAGAAAIIERLEMGEHVVYVTDAGTPGISDPGARLVRAVRDQLGDDVTIEAIPGPSALSAALSVAGITADRFVFLGFLPHKKGRQTLLKEIAVEKRAVVLYESPHRIRKLLTELSENLTSNRTVVIARELTKMHEEVLRGTANELLERLREGQERGEFVVLIDSTS